MRKSKAEYAKTRERIPRRERQFLSHGITEAGLAQLCGLLGHPRAVSTAISLPRSVVSEACSQAATVLASGLNPKSREASRSSAAVLVAISIPHHRPARDRFVLAALAE